MKTPVLDHIAELHAEGFAHVDSFVLETDEDDLVLRFEGAPPSSSVSLQQRPSVYAWVACRKEASEVIYVGMASRGWRVRRGQHAQGLRLSDGAGAKNRLGIVTEIEGHAVVKVFERFSGSARFFGRMAPTHGAEEWALLARFRPKLNRLSDVMRACGFDDKE